MKRALIAIAFILLSCQAGPTTAHANNTAEQKEAMQFVENLLDTLPRISQDMPPKEMLKLVEDTIDVSWIAGFVLGTNWRHLTKEDKKEFIATYKKFAMYTYFQEVSSLTQKKIRITSVERSNSKREKYNISLTITDESGDTEVIMLVHRKRSGELSAYDVKPAGISIIITQRNEFSEIVKEHGLQHLLTIMRDKIQTEEEKRS